MSTCEIPFAWHKYLCWRHRFFFPFIVLQAFSQHTYIIIRNVIVLWPCSLSACFVLVPCPCVFPTLLVSLAAALRPFLSACLLAICARLFLPYLPACLRPCLPTCLSHLFISCPASCLPHAPRGQGHKKMTSHMFM